MTMRLSKQDLVATVLVATAGIFYLLWVVEQTLPGMDSVRVTGAVILVLGFAASAVAVVPGFERLMHGNKLYLAVTSALGLSALVAAVFMMVSGSGAALLAVVATMAVLWLIATIHHGLLARTARETRETHPQLEHQSAHRG